MCKGKNTVFCSNYVFIICLRYKRHRQHYVERDKNKNIFNYSMEKMKKKETD
jgi:hypothetical protein